MTEIVSRLISFSYLFVCLFCCSLGNFEDSEQSERTQDADPETHSRSEETPDHLEDAANDHLHNISGLVVVL